MGCFRAHRRPGTKGRAASSGLRRTIKTTGPRPSEAKGARYESQIAGVYPKSNATAAAADLQRRIGALLRGRWSRPQVVSIRPEKHFTSHHALSETPLTRARAVSLMRAPDPLGAALDHEQDPSARPAAPLAAAARGGGAARDAAASPLRSPRYRRCRRSTRGPAAGGQRGGGSVRPDQPKFEIWRSRPPSSLTRSVRITRCCWQ